MSALENMVDDFANRIGLATADQVLMFGGSPEAQVAAGGYEVAHLLLGVAEDLLDEEDFALFVEVLRDGMARYEEMTA